MALKSCHVIVVQTKERIKCFHSQGEDVPRQASFLPKLTAFLRGFRSGCVQTPPLSRKRMNTVSAVEHMDTRLLTANAVQCYHPRHADPGQPHCFVRFIAGYDTDAPQSKETFLFLPLSLFDRFSIFNRWGWTHAVSNGASVRGAARSVCSSGLSSLKKNSS